MKQNIDETIEVPQGVTATIKDSTITVKGPKGEVVKGMRAPGVTITSKDNKISLKSKKATKREKRMLNTFRAHINNMLKGVQENWVYKLKICSGHFPMNVSLSGNVFAVKNFLGEKVPRQCKLPEGAVVKVAGQDITITSADRDIAGQIAGRLELLTFKPNKDQRTFQDGIYITLKPGAKVQK